MKKIFTVAAILLLTANPGIFAQSGNPNTTKDRPVSNKPFVTYLELGYAHGYMDYEYDYYGADLIYSYHANPHFSTGLGIGVHNYAWGFPQYYGGNVVLPIYVDFRYYPLTGRFSPYALVKGGYSVVLWKEVGVYAMAGAGCKFNYSARHSILFNLSYGIQNFQSFSYNYNVGSFGHSTDFKFIEALGVSLGWTF